MIGLTFGDTTYGRGVAEQFNIQKGKPGTRSFALLRKMAELDLSGIFTSDGRGYLAGIRPEISRVCASHANAQALTLLTAFER